MIGNQEIKWRLVGYILHHPVDLFYFRNYSIVHGILPAGAASGDD